MSSADAAAPSAPIMASSSAMERCSRSGRSTQSAIAAATTKSPNTSSRST